jgi:hypothetical protein
MSSGSVENTYFLCPLWSSLPEGALSHDQNAFLRAQAAPGPSSRDARSPGEPSVALSTPRR